MAPNTKNTQILKAKHFVKGHGFTSELFKSVKVEIDSNLNEGDILIRTIYLGMDPCKFLPLWCAKTRPPLSVALIMNIIIFGRADQPS